MRFKKFAATSALVIAALGVATGTAHAAPVIPSVLDGVDQGVGQVLPSIGWNTKIEGDSVVLETTAGSLTTDNGQFQVRDDQGNLVTQFPLAYSLGDLEYPVTASVNGLRAVLTPSTDRSAARPVALPLHNVASQEAFDDAVSAAATQFGIITSIGTLIGTIVGGGLGCAIGAAGGVIGGLVILSAPGGVAGCLVGAGIGIPLGAAAGLVLTGVPAAIIVGIGFANRINAPENQ
ncbi:hypothetical protein [Nocardia huaxiensis]|uniref:DUF8020 domain-containing protein n=1 Tax=Nocardia huaxiensis TaxID=2755382 RepID=A0A7D6ZHF6_9NOCA|nr:hypothetical protein [Nocardia huaxiensis]QLY29820.1 hypothetical protein H0264_32150 [Nocardia huaxiensis]UFS96591.1 hypothetical protein LPY97_01220 [Nocardia huaxiensis]